MGNEMDKPERLFSFQKYEKWNLEIFAAIAEFMDQYQACPTEIRVNAETSTRVSVQMSAELSKEGKIDGFEQIGVFACPLGELTFITDESLSDDCFILTIDTEHVGADEGSIEELLKKAGRDEDDYFVYPGVGEC